jgi:hypothetical protein
MASTCNNQKDDTDSSFISFARSLMKSFILLTVVIMTISLKDRLITGDTTLFYTAIFITATTLLFTLVSIVDSYVYSNLILGVGLALGLQIMDMRKL